MTIEKLVEEQRTQERNQRRSEERKSQQRNAEYLRSQKHEHGWDEENDDAA